MQSSDQGRRWSAWLAAAKTLGDDPEADVRCPVCRDGILAVEELMAELPNGRYVEQILRCPLCGAWNSVLKEVPNRA